MANEAAEAAVNQVGAMLEQLGARFDLVLEAVSGFGGRLEALREEIVGQFTEVGRQIRFLSDRIAENREAVMDTRSDLGAEMIRVGEALGTARVEFRESIATTRRDLGDQIAAEAATARESASEMARTATQFQARIKEVSAKGEGLRLELAAPQSDELASKEARGAASASGDSLKKIDAGLKQTNKSLASLMRKFERFDDRITVQTKDQDQRIRKLEQRAHR
ncbi:MAG: hypothetical protein ACREQ4_12990 [Candidatus Binataceae bacterium]